MSAPTGPTARPDIIIILTDQERAAPEYEDDTVAAWRQRRLPGRRWFDDHGVSFTRHYTGSVACVPSRPTLFTGHYPDTHGVTQTDGIGKEADDSRMRWLRPDEVPTMGHWFRAAGYDTYYDGKWHLTHADLHDTDGNRVVTNTASGEVVEHGLAAYRAADVLDPFGFSGWVGPEPHGADVADCGLVRDPLIAARVVAWLSDRYSRRLAGDPEALRPFLCVASFVNPHDIVMFPAWIRRGEDSPVAVDPFDTPTIAPPPTLHEDLSTKPAVQARYRDTYPTAYGPAEVVGAVYADEGDTYRRMYHRLHGDVDGPLDAVRQMACDGAASGGAPAGTVVVRSADHGELLGAHGGLHQKWFTLYDEAVRVPLSFVHLDADGEVTTMSRSAERVDAPSSHVDLLPTLLDAAGLHESELASVLASQFSEVHPLPGRSLWPTVGNPAAAGGQRTIYLQTRDDILEGDQRDGLAARHWHLEDAPPEFHIAVPTSAAANLEAVIGRVDGDHGAGHLWKLVRTFDDPACWTEPGVRQLATSGPDGVTWRHDVLAEEWELYDLDGDPHEVENLAHLRGTDAGVAAVFDVMVERLAEERRRCLPGRNVPWPYATAARSFV